MAIEDILSRLPKVFGTTPEVYRGLLTPEQSAGLEKRANLAGLLGFGAALAQGMSPQGYRRSPLQNILTAAGAGFGGAGQTFDAGLNQLANVQKLQQSQAQITAINQLLQVPEIANDPMMVAYIRANPGEAIKYFAEMAPLKAAISGGTPAPSVTPSVSTGTAAGAMAVPSAAAPSAVPSAVSTPAATTTEAAPAVPEKAALPEVAIQESPVVDFMNQKQSLMDEINALTATNLRIAKDPKLTGRLATDFRAANNAQIANLQNQVKELDNQINRVLVANFDFKSVIDSVPDEFKGRIKAIQKTAAGGTLSMEKVSDRVDAVLNDANQFAMKQVDFTQENNALFGSMFKNADGTPRKLGSATSEELSKLLAEKQRRDKELRIAGRSQQIVNVSDKILAQKRAEAQVKAESSAIDAQSAASDVRAIVDVLKPFRGGALQDLAGQVGAYLPGTSAEQLATARQVSEAIRNRLAPTLRVEGSGSTSNFEVSAFLAALPSLMNTREGRELMATYAQRLADRAAAAADIRGELGENFTVEGFRKLLKDRGLEKVFTENDLKLLGSKKIPTEAGTNLSTEGQKAFEKYRPR